MIDQGNLEMTQKSGKSQGITVGDNWLWQSSKHLVC